MSQLQSAGTYFLAYAIKIKQLREQIDRLGDRWKQARKAGHDLNAKDKQTLLALLLEERFLGTLGRTTL
jgi:hypothetical protein